MEFRIAHLPRSARLAWLVPLVGSWFLGCPNNEVRSAERGVFSAPMAGQALQLHGKIPPPLMVPREASPWPARDDGASRDGPAVAMKADLQPPPALAEPPRPAPQPRMDAPLLPAAPKGVPIVQVRPPRRPRFVILVARRAEEHIRYAQALAERGAAYSAQAEFIQALKLISQALDQEHGTRFHGRAMSAGLRALREADDFVAGDSDDLQAIDLAHCVAAHRTPLLKNVDTTEITPMDALQEYHTFASQQLAAACGRESAGSKALYGLARLQPVLNVGSEPRRSTAETNAIALHQAALTVDPRNHTAANELGVLLARYGQMEAAQSLLRQSLAVRQTAEAWRNLTVVYQEMGAMDAAGWARRQGEIFAASPSSQDNAPESPKESMVYWVDAATLARGSGAAEPVGPVMPTTPPAEPQIASPWPREVPMTAASPEPAPASNPVEQFKSFFGLGEQGHETRDMPPETTSRPQRETLR